MIHSSASQRFQTPHLNQVSAHWTVDETSLFRTKSGIISVLTWKYCRPMIPPFCESPQQQKKCLGTCMEIVNPSPLLPTKKTPKMAFRNLVCDPSAAVSPSGSSYYSLQRPLRPYAKPAGLVLENGQNMTFWYILQGVRQRHNGCFYTNILYIAQYGQWVYVVWSVSQCVICLEESRMLRFSRLLVIPQGKQLTGIPLVQFWAALWPWIHDINFSHKQLFWLEGKYMNMMNMQIQLNQTIDFWCSLDVIHEKLSLMNILHEKNKTACEICLNFNLFQDFWTTPKNNFLRSTSFSRSFFRICAKSGHVLRTGVVFASRFRSCSMPKELSCGSSRVPDLDRHLSQALGDHGINGSQTLWDFSQFRLKVQGF